MPRRVDEAEASDSTTDRAPGGLLARLTGSDAVRRERAGIELRIDCDDIQQIWHRFPGLDPQLTEPQALPGGLLVAGGRELERLAAELAGAAAVVARSLEGSVEELRAAWGADSERPTWLSVAEGLVSGIMFGCAVPRHVSWRAPAAFALDRSVSHAQPAPLLRLVFLPGSGTAGLVLAAGRSLAPVDRLALRADGNDWSQTWDSYDAESGDVVGYGAAAQALAATGVLRRQGVSFQAKWVVTAPLIDRSDFAAVGDAWRRLEVAGAAAADAQVPALRAAAAAAFGADRLTAAAQPDAPPGSALLCDYLDLAYFVLADLAQERLIASIGPGSGSGSRQAKLRPIVLVRPAEVWEWLTCGDRLSR